MNYFWKYARYANQVSLAEPLTVTIDAPTAAAALNRLHTEKVDGYDSKSAGEKAKQLKRVEKYIAVFDLEISGKVDKDIIRPLTESIRREIVTRVAARYVRTVSECLSELFRNEVSELFRNACPNYFGMKCPNYFGMPVRTRPEFPLRPPRNDTLKQGSRFN